MHSTHNVLSWKLYGISSWEHCANPPRIWSWESITIRWSREFQWNRQLSSEQNCYNNSRSLSGLKILPGNRQLYFFFFLLLESLIHHPRILCDGSPPGWLAWDGAVSLYMPPDDTTSTFAPWDQSSQDAIDILRQVVNTPSFWESLSTYYSEENHETAIIQDDVSCVKSICKYMPRTQVW